MSYQWSPAGDVVGRDDERQAIARLLGPPEGALRVLLIDGEAGIGKTTLLRKAVGDARAAGWTVLGCAPSEAEAALAFAALGDLIDATADPAAWDSIDETQRVALSPAVPRQPAVDPIDPLTVSRAVTAFLQAASQRRLLLTIDDVQWLDEPSAEALTFALRRIGDRALSVLVTRRSRVDLPPPLGLDRAPALAGMESRRLGPLSLGELDELLRSRLDLRLPRPRLEAVHTASDGNPLYAMEIARNTPDVASSPDFEVRIPRTLSQLLTERLIALPQEANEAILLAALASRATAEIVAAAAGGDAGLRAAIDAGLLLLERDRLRFGHPLLAAVAAEAALPTELRAAHARLAPHCNDEVTRALHLARAAAGPDPTLAAELEAAAATAAHRGAASVAATLARHATALTNPADAGAHRRRTVLQSDYLVAAGDPQFGRALLQRLIADTPAGPERAGYLRRMAETVGDDLAESIHLSEQALVEASGSDAVLAEIHTALGVFTWLAGDLRRSTEHIAKSAEAARRAGDERALAIALGELCHAETVLGRPYDTAAMDQAIEIETRIGGFPSLLGPRFQLGIVHLYNDELDDARPLLEDALAHVRETGNERGHVGVLFRLAELELRAGRLDRAVAFARETMILARQSGNEQEQSVGLMIDALVQAHVGDLETATEHAERAHRFAVAAGDAIILCRSAGTLGFVALSAGDAERALAWLEPASADLRRLGIGELCISQVANNEIDALLAVKRLDDAEDRIRWVEDAGRPTGRTWHRLVAARGHALVAAERQDEEAAASALSGALAEAEELSQPFERARTLLAAGTVERRFRHWGSARRFIAAALDLFDSLGAARWSERAAGELGRLPGRPPVPRGQAESVSETESHIGRLVAKGLSNKEIAGRLSVTVRTVESHLTRLYAKLGLRSRAELAHAVADWPAKQGPA